MEGPAQKLKIHSDTDLTDYTANTIEGARTRLLSHSQSQTPSPIPFMSRVTSLLREESKKPWPRSLKLFGRSPWHRRDSLDSENSASSSLRDALRGRTPVTSPASDIGASITERCFYYVG